MRFINAKMISICLSLLCLLCAVTVFAAPVETSHWNSNTFGNLNALTDKTTITFSVSYNGTGDITWYKDGVEAGTFSSTNTAQYTTSWSETGMKEVKAEMFDGAETSMQTIWTVEVQETGTANLEHATKYPQLRIRAYWTINVRSGWTSFPDLYLRTKDTGWIEYVSSGTYIMKANIDIRENGVLKADDGSVTLLKMRALPQYTDHMPSILRACVGGSISIDSMTIIGWDVDQSSEIVNSIQSPKIYSTDTGTLRITNSSFRHIAILYASDTSPGDLVDHNTFYQAKPNVLDLTGSTYQVITNNALYNGDNLNEGEANMTGGGYLTVKYNKFIGPATCADNDTTAFGGNVSFGAGSTVIGNEITHAGWNLAEVHKNVFCRDNVLYQNDGNHNGFNGMLKDVYSFNDYFYDFTNYSAFYSQLKDDGHTYPVPLELYPDHIYLINGHAKNAVRGFCFFGGFNCYVYNFLCENASGNFQYGTDNAFVRKCQFKGVQAGTKEKFRVCDYAPTQYRYIRNVTIMDSVFDYAAPVDLRFNPMSDGVVNVINCYRIDAGSRAVIPSSSLYWDGEKNNTASNPEMRFYVWLDALVKDQTGRPVKDANVTVQCLPDTVSPALKVTLPPPPPDMWEMPSEYLPQPSVETFARLKTLSTGKLPGPNYGWSTDPEPCVALLMRKLSLDRSSGSILTKATTGYHYVIRAAYHGLEASRTVIPDESWLREVSSEPVVTVELVLNGDSTTGTDTTPPAVNITMPENNTPVYGTTAIEAMASDNWDIDRMEIFVDNVSRAVIAGDSCTWTADGYICCWNWNTALEREGLHGIKVVAYDTSGNAASKTVTVEILTETVKTSNKAIVYPNPYIKGKSSGSMCIFANLPADATVRIYTISGDLVATLTAEAAGEKGSAAWDVSRVSGGIYLYTVHSSKDVQKGKIGIVK